MIHINYRIVPHNGTIEITWWENEGTDTEYLAHRTYYGYTITEAITKWKKAHNIHETIQAHRA